MGMKTAIFFIFLGIFIWLLNLGIFSFWQWKRDWPWIFIIIGLVSVIDYFFCRSKRRKRSKKTSIQILLTKLEKGEISVQDAIEQIKKCV